MTKRRRKNGGEPRPAGTADTPRADRTIHKPDLTGEAPTTTRTSPRAHHEHSAGGVVMRRGSQRDEMLVLLIRDSYENWGFPKGHVESGEDTAHTALREVAEETGLAGLELRELIATIEWWFRFRGRLIHKICDFFLMVAEPGTAMMTSPQRAEGITACEWVPYHEARERISYPNARDVLAKAHAMMIAVPADGI